MNVLLVEDHESDRIVYREAVRKVDPTAGIFEATNLSEALSLIDDQPFDLALIDLSLAGDRKAGARVVEALQPHERTMLVVISGLDVATWRPIMFRRQVWDYFEKPIDLGSLAEVIRRAAARAAGRETALVSPNPVRGLDWDQSDLRPPSWRGQPVHLSQTEQRILAELVRTPNVLVKRETLYDCFQRWDRDPGKLRSSLTTAIYELRRAFEAVEPGFDRIVAVGSVGYLWRDD